jgi:hypothetical protein
MVSKDRAGAGSGSGRAVGIARGKDAVGSEPGGGATHKKVTRREILADPFASSSEQDVER